MARFATATTGLLIGCVTLTCRQPIEAGLKAIDKCTFLFCDNSVQVIWSILVSYSPSGERMTSTPALWIPKWQGRLRWESFHRWARSDCWGSGRVDCEMVGSIYHGLMSTIWTTWHAQHSRVSLIQCWRFWPGEEHLSFHWVWRILLVRTLVVTFLCLEISVASGPVVWSINGGRDDCCPLEDKLCGRTEVLIFK